MLALIETLKCQRSNTHGYHLAAMLSSAQLSCIVPTMPLRMLDEHHKLKHNQVKASPSPPHITIRFLGSIVAIVLSLFLLLLGQPGKLCEHVVEYLSPYVCSYVHMSFGLTIKVYVIIIGCLAYGSP